METSSLLTRFHSSVGYHAGFLGRKAPEVLQSYINYNANITDNMHCGMNLRPAYKRESISGTIGSDKRTIIKQTIEPSIYLVK